MYPNIDKFLWSVTKMCVWVYVYVPVYVCMDMYAGVCALREKCKHR